jgi:hypothetical protein
MLMLGETCVFGARPKRLASVFPIDDITFDARCRLIRTRNSVGRILHELGEAFMARILAQLWKSTDEIRTMRSLSGLRWSRHDRSR